MPRASIDRGKRGRAALAGGGADSRRRCASSKCDRRIGSPVTRRSCWIGNRARRDLLAFSQAVEISDNSGMPPDPREPIFCAYGHAMNAAQAVEIGVRHLFQLGLPETERSIDRIDEHIAELFA